MVEIVSTHQIDPVGDVSSALAGARWAREVALNKTRGMLFHVSDVGETLVAFQMHSREDEYPTDEQLAKLLEEF